VAVILQKASEVSHTLQTYGLVRFMRLSLFWSYSPRVVPGGL